MRVCTRCKTETDEMFCPTCRVLTQPSKTAEVTTPSSSGDSFECTIWQGPSRSRGILIQTVDRDRYFSKSHDMVVLHIDGLRTIAKLGAGFWKKPSIIKKATSDDGKEQMAKFLEKHHLLPPEHSLKEKGIVDTLVFEVISPTEEFKVTVSERRGNGDEDADSD
jgi:hypothetical protein